MSIVFKVLFIIFPLLFLGAYLTYIERRLVAFIQMRKGPNVVGPLGLLQPIADAIKLITKEFIIPKDADKGLFLLAPVITLVLSLIGWAVIPFDSKLVLANINVGILYILAVFSLSSYGIIIAGWASNSKYAFLASIRAITQIISYELIAGIIIVIITLVTGSLNLIDIVEAQKNRPLWLNLLLLPMGAVFFITMLVKTNRCPFDLSEADSELVGGYNVEYSSMAFALLFLGEYINMVLTSSLTVILFLGGYLPPFNLKFLSFIPGIGWLIIKSSFLLFCFIWIRATLPRYRYDQLMSLGWKVLLPLVLFWLILMSVLLFFRENIELIIQ